MFENFSIGEEESESHVHSLAWSPPGVSKHGYCALAVYTSNLLLSIWLVTADPVDPSSWKRACIINNALRAHNEVRGRDSENRVESQRRAFRVRAFAWAPPFTLTDISPLHSITWPAALLAVLDDQSEVILLKLSYPNSTFTGEALSADVLFSYALNLPKSDDPTGEPTILEWLPWSLHNDDLVSSVTSKYGQTTHTSIIRLGVLDPANRSDVGIKINKFEITTPRESPNSWSSHRAQAAESTNLYLLDYVRSMKNEFAEKHELEDRVRVMYWGHCIYKQYVAILISLHPSTMIQYTTPTNELSHIVFSHTELRDSLESLESYGFEWETSHVLKPLSEGGTKPWLFVVKHFPLERVLLQSTNSPSDSMGLDSDSSHVSQFSETLCRRLIHSYFCSALLCGWPIHERATALVQWACGNTTQSMLAIQETIKPIESFSQLGDKVSSIDKMNEILSAQDILFQNCEICESKILWNGLETARCTEGHSFSRQAHYTLLEFALNFVQVDAP